MTNSDENKRALGTRWCKTAIVLGSIAAIATILGLGAGITGAAGPMFAFGAFGIGGLLFAVTIVISLIGLALSKGTGGGASAAATWAVLTIAVIVISASMSQRPDLENVPSIHDVTTDTNNPPAFVDIVALRGEESNPAEYLDDGTAALQLEAFPDIVTLSVAKPTAEVFAAAEQVARNLGWEIIAADQAGGRIEATASTEWFGFKDDVVIRIMDGDGVTRVDVRSKSRLGRGDMGMNANRVREFLRALRENTGA